MANIDKRRLLVATALTISGLVATGVVMWVVRTWPIIGVLLVCTVIVGVLASVVYVEIGSWFE